jgi:hypothetical protein
MTGSAAAPGKSRRLRDEPERIEGPAAVAIAAG